MLIDLSFKAIQSFSSSIQPMKDSLQSYYDFCESNSFEYILLANSNKLQSPTQAQLQNERFIDDNLKQDIAQLTQLSTVKFRCGITEITLSIYHKEESIELFVSYILKTIAFVVNIGHHTISTLDITMYLLDSKRVFDGDTLLDKEEVNGGSCFPTDTTAKITVWRKEEILKVTIHELIHALNYDYNSDTPEIVQHYQQKYSIISPKMNTFEAYTEIHAELIHSYLLAYWTDGPTLDMFQANVCLEREFSRFQTSKVLSLKNKDMNRETNVCAYYIITTELYDNLASFLQFCKNTNESMIRMTHLTKYITYLKKLKKVNNNKKYKLSKLFYQTTRMTCLELNLFRG